MIIQLNVHFLPLPLDFGGLASGSRPSAIASSLLSCSRVLTSASITDFSALAVFSSLTLLPYFRDQKNVCLKPLYIAITQSSPKYGPLWV